MGTLAQTVLPFKLGQPLHTFKQLDAQAREMSDNDAALALNNARRKLFHAISAAIKKQA